MKRGAGNIKAAISKSRLMLKKIRNRLNLKKIIANMNNGNTQKIKCFSCGGLVPDIDGPTHKYVLSAPGCWKLYGDIVAKEFMPENYDPDVHRISVDTYAVQHPGKPERRAIQSVNGHLISLYAMLEKGLRGKEATAVLKKAVEDKKLKEQFQWLEPPSFESTMTVADVVKAEDFEEHAKLVRKWGESVWAAWKAKHHDRIVYLAAMAMRGKS